MTQSDGSEDSDWLNAIAGTPNPSGGPANSQGAALREALQKRSHALEQRVPQADPLLYQQIVSGLKTQGLLSVRSFSWKALTLLTISAFAVGSVSMRMMMLSATTATRSSSTSVDLKGKDGYVQTVTVKVSDPVKTAQSAAIEAIRLGLTVAVDSDAGAQRVTISGFVPLSPDQEGLREVLGISKTAQGTLLFVISKTLTP